MGQDEGETDGMGWDEGETDGMVRDGMRERLMGWEVME